MDEGCPEGADEAPTDRGIPIPKPFVDFQGMIRAGGRVDATLVSYNTKHPILLQSDHRVLYLITKHVHTHGHLR